MTGHVNGSSIYLPVYSCIYTYPTHVTEYGGDRQELWCSVEVNMCNVKYKHVNYMPYMVNATTHNIVSLPLTSLTNNVKHSLSNCVI